MGVLGLTVSPEFGGFGQGAASQLVVHRELGRGLVLEPVIPSAVMATAVLAAYGSKAQQQALAPRACRRRARAALAYLEPRHPLPPGGRARQAPGAAATAYVLNGIKSLAWHGAAADALLVSARVAGSNDLRAISGAARRARPDYRSPTPPWMATAAADLTPS
ncbi:acyl-CoA dehydrogenase family protein [Cupriavidus basilensis]